MRAACSDHDPVHSPAPEDRRRRGVLWAALAINVLLFIGEFGAGLWADSAALLSDSADNLGDVLTYAISLAALGGALRRRARVAGIKGMIQILFGLAVLAEVGRKAWMGFEPVAPVMLVAAALALVGNLACFVMLLRERHADINMRSVWLCSRNDVIGNASVIAAAFVVWLTGFAWADLVVGATLAALFLSTGVGVVRDARHAIRPASFPTRA